VKLKTPDNCLIVCNGEIDTRLLRKFFQLNLKEKKLSVFAADGAANTLYKHKLVPDLITGDFDSIKPAALSYFKSKKVEIRKIFNQNRNDFDKALGFAISRQHRKISVLGATGKRLDHTLNNLSILKQYHHMADIKLYDSEFEIFYTENKTEFTYPKGEVVSLIALAKAEKIKTKGLKYPLKDKSLEFGSRQGALNSSNAETVSIETGKGELLVFKKHFGKITQ
jgi:thiamine pyrophosphokinase